MSKTGVLVANHCTLEPDHKGNKDKNIHGTHLVLGKHYIYIST